jgi:hypothetical protein
MIPNGPVLRADARQKSLKFRRASVIANNEPLGGHSLRGGLLGLGPLLFRVRPGHPRHGRRVRRTVASFLR